MSECCGFGRKRRQLNDDREPLLPQYEDETALQRRLHQKLHSYQMFRAMSQGYMPSNEQVIINLRTLLSSDVLNPETTGLSDSGRLLAKYSKLWLHQFVDLLQHKNDRDQVQDFAWCLANSSISVDTGDISRRASKVKAKADTAAAYQSLRTVGSLLLTNSEFRIFLSDLQSVGRDVFKDSAFAISRAAEDAGNKIDAIPTAPDMPGGAPRDTQQASSTGEKQASEPQKLRRGSDLLKDALGQGTTEPKIVSSQPDSSTKARRGSDLLKEALGEGPSQPNGTASQPDGAPSKADLKQEVATVSKIVGKEAVAVGKEAQESVEEHLSGKEQDVLLSRLKGAVMRLRNRPDYTDSVSTLSLLIKRWALVYSRAAEDVVETAQKDIDESEEVDQAAKNFWLLLRSFGDSKEWEKLEACFKQLAQHQKRNPQLEDFMIQVGNTLQSLLTDPKAMEHASEKFSELRRKANESVTDNSIREDVENLFTQITTTFYSVVRDDDVTKLSQTSLRLFHVLSPAHNITNQDLLNDTVNIFVPLLINAIQYIPIPRLEISTPEIDLLLENLIIEPGRTVNNTSFLPFRFRAETYNDLEIRKTHTLSTVSHTTSLLTLKIDGLSLRADDIGYWLRLKTGLFNLQDEGIASFALDQRGVDIAIDVAISRPSASLESILTLRGVRVKIHKLTYTLRRSKFSWLAFLLKPLLKPILKRTIERQLATAVADFFHAANRELVFARERLRATRIADPADLATFFRAVAARLIPAEDPDVYARLGVDTPSARGNIFRGRYAPGSVVKLWHEEARLAEERIDDWRRDGWRNDVFDVVVAPSAMTP